MRGLYLQNGELSYRDDLESPKPGPDEVVVRSLRAGICATDLALARGYMGFTGIPGHEFVGIAENGAHEGRRVVGDINAACGKCRWCRDGVPHHCPHRTVLGILDHGGAFAERLVLPEANLFPVPDEVSTDAATFTEPLAAAFEIPNQLGETALAGKKVLVVGDGKLGLLCAWVLHLSDAWVTVAGRHPERSELLWENMRIRPDVLEQEQDQDNQFDVVVEATGDPDVLPQVLSFVRPRGRIVLKTTTERPTSLDLSLVVVNELEILGSRCGPFELALDALAKGRVPVESLIAGRYALEDGPAAFAHAASKGTLKVLLQHEPRE